MVTCPPRAQVLRLPRGSNWTSAPSGFHVELLMRLSSPGLVHPNLLHLYMVYPHVYERVQGSGATPIITGVPPRQGRYR